MKHIASLDVVTGAVSFGAPSTLGIQRQVGDPQWTGTIRQSFIPPSVPCHYQSLSLYSPRWTTRQLVNAVKSAQLPVAWGESIEMDDFPIEAFVFCSSSANPDDITEALLTYVIPCVLQTKFNPPLFNYPNTFQYHYINRYDWAFIPFDAGTSHECRNGEERERLDVMDRSIFIVDSENAARTREAVCSNTLDYKQIVEHKVWEGRNGEGIRIDPEMEYRYGCSLFDREGYFEVLVVFDDSFRDCVPFIDIGKVSEMTSLPSDLSWKQYAAGFSMTDEDRDKLRQVVKELALECAEKTSVIVERFDEEEDKQLLCSLASHLSDASHHAKFVTDGFYRALQILRRTVDLQGQDVDEKASSLLRSFFDSYNEAELEYRYNEESDGTWEPESDFETSSDEEQDGNVSESGEESSLRPSGSVG